MQDTDELVRALEAEAQRPVPPYTPPSTPERQADSLEELLATIMRGLPAKLRFGRWRR